METTAALRIFCNAAAVQFICLGMARQACFHSVISQIASYSNLYFLLSGLLFYSAILICSIALILPNPLKAAYGIIAAIGFIKLRKLQTGHLQNLYSEKMKAGAFLEQCVDKNSGKED